MSTPTEQWYQIHLYNPSVTFGLKTEGGIVTDVAPIGSWMRGKKVEVVLGWVDSKKGKHFLIDTSGEDSGTIITNSIKTN